MVVADQNPESARMVSSPLAPARRTRAASSSTNRAAPRALLARPERWRAREHLTAVSTRSEQRMVAKRVGVAVGSALLVVAVHLAHRRVQVHGHRPTTGSGTSGPRPGKDLLGEPVELADVPEGERAQERPQGGGGHDPVAQQLAGGAAAQPVGVVDTVPTSDHGVDQGQQLAAGPVRASPLAQVDQRIGGLLDAQPLGQGGRQQQARIGDGMGVVNAAVELVQGWQDPIENAPS
jgi:hypothetical protein